MKNLVIAILLVANFIFAYELSASWQRNKHLASINAELYRDGVHQNDYIEKLRRELRDAYSLFDRIMIDHGGIVFNENGKVE